MVSWGLSSLCCCCWTQLPLWNLLHLGLLLTAVWREGLEQRSNSWLPFNKIFYHIYLSGFSILSVLPFFLICLSFSLLSNPWLDWLRGQRHSTYHWVSILKHPQNHTDCSKALVTAAASARCRSFGGIAARSRHSAPGRGNLDIPTGSCLHRLLQFG